MTEETPRKVIIARLHREYAPVIYNLCLRLLRDHSEAEDAVQETFINAYRFWSTFRQGERPLPWLYRIGTNVCLKHFRKHKAKGVELLKNPERVQLKTRDPASDYLFRDTLAKLVEKMDERNMEILVAHFVTGMDQSQIAQMLGISRRAVVKRLTRIRAEAGELLAELER